MDGRLVQRANLERSSAPAAADWVRVAPGNAPGSDAVQTVERIEACFQGHAYSPHRHDTAAFGITISGVQSFHYRGAEHHSLPGNVIVLLPDELHDGHASRPGGFRYRMLYVDPLSMGSALRELRTGLPLESGVLNAPALRAAVASGLADLEEAMTPLAATALIGDLAAALVLLTGSPAPGDRYADETAVRQARRYMLENLQVSIGLEALERVTGQSRYALNRHFRRVCGVSPHRWLILRRLDRARARILAGASLAEAAAVSGFADQSHMTRHFRQAFGVSPGAWRSRLTRGRRLA